MNFIDHIKAVLRAHDRAFIPGFGGFVAERKPAWIDRNKHLFHPPFSSIMFNKDLNHDDGLLAERIRQKEGIPFDKAREEIHGKVREWKHELDNTGRIELRGIGILFKDERGAIQFEPEADTDLCLYSYGLTSFYCSPVRTFKAKESQEKAPRESIRAKETPIREIKPSEPLEEENKPKEKSPNKKGSVKPEPTEGITSESKQVQEQETEGRTGKKKLLRIAAILLPIALIGLLVAYFLKTPSSRARQFTEVFNFKGTVEQAYSPREPDPKEDPGSIPVEGSRETDRELPFKTELFENGKTVVVVPDDKRPKNKTSKVDNTKVEVDDPSARPYHVIGGCFKYRSNAEERVRKLRKEGYQARILEEKRKGLHPVAFGSYATRKEALSILRSAREEESGAWILRNRDSH